MEYIDTTFDLANPQVDTPADLAKGETSSDRAIVKRWAAELRHAEQYFKPYFERCEEVLKRYRDERSAASGRIEGETQDTTRRYNIYWAMVEIYRAHLFQEAPQPYVSRAFLDKDPAALDASRIIQRILEVLTGNDAFYAALERAVDDTILYARGVTWVRYTSTVKLRPSEIRTRITSKRDLPSEADAPDGYEEGEDEEGKYYRVNVPVKVDEEVDCAHVLWRNFLCQPGQYWERCEWVSRMEPLTQEELINRFGREIGTEVPLKAKDRGKPRDGSDRHGDEARQVIKRAEVYEIWSKTDRKVYWICPDYPDRPLDVRDDFYGLKDFFPCPKPIFFTTTTDSLIPIPDYAILQGLLNELDDVTDRIRLLTEALRVVGFYDARYADDLNGLLSHSIDNEMVPLENFAMFGETGGMSGAVQFFPIGEVAGVLQQLTLRRPQLIEELNRISGIPDVMQGASDYRETKGGQQRAGEFGTMRLRKRQHRVAAHARGVLQIMAELVAKHFSPEKIRRLSSADQFLTTAAPPPPTPPASPGQPAPPAPAPARPPEVFDQARFQAAVGLLKDEVGRQIRIEIDTETLSGTKTRDDQQMRRMALESVGGYLQQAVSAAQSAPALSPLLIRLLQFAIRSHHVGREFEHELNETIERVLATDGKPENPNAQRGKSPEEMQLEKQRLQIEQAKVQLEQQRVQLEQQRFQIDAQEKMGRLQLDGAGREREAALRGQKQQADASLRAGQLDLQRQAHEAKVAASELENEIRIAKVVADSKAAADQIRTQRDEAAAKISADMDKRRGEREDSRAEIALQHVDKERDRLSRERATRVKGVGRGEDE